MLAFAFQDAALDAACALAAGDSQPALALIARAPGRPELAGLRERLSREVFERALAPERELAARLLVLLTGEPTELPAPPLDADQVLELLVAERNVELAAARLRTALRAHCAVFCRAALRSGSPEVRQRRLRSPFYTRLHARLRSERQCSDAGAHELIAQALSVEMLSLCLGRLESDPELSRGPLLALIGVSLQRAMARRER